jgi:hypothetical protein
MKLKNKTPIQRFFAAVRSLISPPRVRFVRVDS